MLFNSIILAISSSIDSLGIGITYGIKNTKITYSSKLILFAISFCVSIISIWFGDTVKNIFSDFYTKLIGTIILFLMGIFMIFQSLHKEDKFCNAEKSSKNLEPILEKEKIYSFFIKFLGITIQIIKNPNCSDFDNSNLIEPKEALFLGIALSLDSFCIGIGGSMMGISSIFFPIFIGIFQLIFLSIGNFIGKKIKNFHFLPENIWSILSGILLILIGLSKIVF